MITAERKGIRPRSLTTPPRRWPEAVWTPATVAVVTLILGLLSVGVGRPLLFPSLAPATVTQASTPRLPTARAWNTVGGQLIAIGAAYLAVWLTGATAAPSVMTAGHLAYPRVWASVLGVAIGLAVQVPLKAVNPAAASTLLLITFGAFAPIARDFWTLVGGVLVMAVLGEAARHFRLAQGESKAG